MQIRRLIGCLLRLAHLLEQSSTEACFYTLLHTMVFKEDRFGLILQSDGKQISNAKRQIPLLGVSCFSVSY